MSGLDDDSNWTLTHSGIEQDEKGGISPIRLMSPRSCHTIRVWCGSQQARGHWWLGGTLTQILGTGLQPDFEGSRWKIPLNRITLVQLPQLTPEYRLKFEPARWHREIHLTIEEYTG